MKQLLVIQTTRFDWSDDSDPTVRLITRARVVWRRRHARRLIGRAIRRGHPVSVRKMGTSEILRALQALEDDQ